MMTPIRAAELTVPSGLVVELGQLAARRFGDGVVAACTIVAKDNEEVSAHGWHWAAHADFKIKKQGWQTKGDRTWAGMTQSD